jgi:hypothetical protein
MMFLFWRILSVSFRILPGTFRVIHNFFYVVTGPRSDQSRTGEVFVNSVSDLLSIRALEQTVLNFEERLSIRPG